jgi:hypothetical protein
MPPYRLLWLGPGVRTPRGPRLLCAQKQSDHGPLGVTAGYQRRRIVLLPELGRTSLQVWPLTKCSAPDYRTSHGSCQALFVDAITFSPFFQRDQGAEALWSHNCHPERSEGSGPRTREISRSVSRFAGSSGEALRLRRGTTKRVPHMDPKLIASRSAG